MELRRNLLILSLFCFAGCQKGEDFLHHIIPQQPEALHFTHKLKELQGESRVDILWVIDNSGSMGNHQQSVINNANLFIQEFVKKQSLLDWKMGLVSTDDSERPYVGFTPGSLLDKTTPNPTSVFTTAVGELGTWGSGIEKPFACARKVLMDNPNWTRPKAILAVILVTDAEEQSSITASDFVQFLAQVKGNTKQVVVYGALGPTDWGCPASDSWWKFAGSPYETVSTQLAGKYFPLCSTTFGTNLADLGKDLVKKISSPRIALSKRPQIGTLKVSWRGKDLPGGPATEGGYWTYDFDLNALIFPNLDFAPDDTEDVVISFEEALDSRTTKTN